ncbi:hypothetical protein M407DRAFT_19438 [Tulasnella calospora MUT 4182]|uniref:Uncharacterized protein n=1 Tax=Tulasnella calospora MUT 4182 TaxID=1051891 RepID=A0A0C3QHU0_9AGAM|nr:hypothetical protein M407DRAFT_19438 [Tulasnella calospora MUT 4182]
MNSSINQNLEPSRQRLLPANTDSGERPRRELGPQSPVVVTRPQQSPHPTAPAEPNVLQPGQNVASLHRRLAGAITAAASLFRRWPLRPFVPQNRPDASPPQEPHPERERDRGFRFTRGGLPRLGPVVPVAVLAYPPPPYTPAPSYHSDGSSVTAGNQNLSS